MKSEQREKIVNKLQNCGFGYISKNDLEKIVTTVWSELIVDAVFTPLKDDITDPGLALRQRKGA